MIPPSQRFTTSARSKIPPARRSIQPLIAWGCAALFALTSILFACLFLSEKHSLQITKTALDMAEQSEAELKSNVQVAEPVAKDNVSELAAEGRQALSGIYYCQQAINKNELDMRSDGSAVWLNDSSGQKFGTAKWTTDGDTVTVGTASRTDNFKIEGTDLIDSRGNRWLHIR
jgi:hypothetical protein